MPARGGKVVVVRGPDKGARGKLLAKNKEDETALIQVSPPPSLKVMCWESSLMIALSCYFTFGGCNYGTLWWVVCEAMPSASVSS